ncbi:MAG: MFS transporter [Thermodesulfobacteriota bacterium]
MKSTNDNESVESYSFKFVVIRVIRKKMDYRKPALLVTTLGSFLIPFMGSSVNIALPSIGKEFSMDAILLSWLTTSYLLTAAMFLVPFGRLGDIHGRRRLFLYGFVIYTLSSVLSAFAPSSLFLIASRVINGIGASMTFSTGVAMLISAYPPEERGTVLGINVAAVYSGLSCGPFFGGFLTQYLGWRSIFGLNIPLGTLIVILTIWKLKGEWTEARGEKFDLFGSVLLSASLVATMYGFSQLPRIRGASSVLLGVLGIVALIKWELKTESPLFNIDLIGRNKVFAFSNLAALINYSATFAVGFLMSLYLQFIKGMSPQEAGTILIAQPIVQALFSPLAGRLSDRLEPRIVASIGMAMTALGLLVFSFLSQEATVVFIVGTLMLLGFGFALFSSPNTNAVMSSVEKKFYGIASGTLGTMRVTGMMFSMGIVMVILAIYIGPIQIAPPTYPLFLKSMRIAFGIFTILCLAGIFASLSRGRVR